MRPSEHLLVKAADEAPWNIRGKVALAHPVLRDTCTSLCNGRSYNPGLR
jgi:hypothetical protein